ncbi:TetR/AcrR family transcriptional regulator [Desmospora profundinema]|uniref:AcrR family transcriptional regulator n=1 Tax=Desmospora profundinema TaxID=1571184 RepID=A0ABU1IR99_9BACL|nr:TetR family transcriptional regulator [Desmospora profundinema]MDR6227315.1 AcrR family transcriptional regulator [Desmospora profundinema]
MSKNINLRELKKARTKLLLLQTTLDLIGQGSMKDLHVEDICRKAEISKVTFFNYFSKKEELFCYFMGIWGLHRAVEQHLHPLRGIAGIRRIFHRVAEEDLRSSGVMLNLIRFLAGTDGKPDVPPITDAEKQVLYPEWDDITEWDLPHLYELFRHFLQESVEDGEVTAEMPLETLTLVTISQFYGAFLSGHNGGVADMKMHYDMHLRLLLANPSDSDVGWIIDKNE